MRRGGAAAPGPQVMTRTLQVNEFDGHLASRGQVDGMVDLCRLPRVGWGGEAGAGLPAGVSATLAPQQPPQPRTHTTPKEPRPTTSPRW